MEPQKKSYHHGDLRQSLIEAALELLTEEQNWLFSLREVARRAGVSHNAPYNHFVDKRDLLGAVAALGFERLRDRMLSAIVGVHRADDALAKTGVVYIRFGVTNPAHYRLMFGSSLGAGDADKPEIVVRAANSAKAVLLDVIERGVARGVFAGLASDKMGVEVGALAAWSIVHGLTMLLIDRLAQNVTRRSIDSITQQVTKTFVKGLTRK
jgi:AcrR family transcriptional regulator